MLNPHALQCLPAWGVACVGLWSRVWPPTCPTCAAVSPTLPSGAASTTQGSYQPTTADHVS